MPKYTFTFKKDDIFVEFITTDKETVERQFQVWVADADEHAKNMSGKTSKPAVKPVQAEEKKVSKPKTIEPEIKTTAEEFAPVKEPQPEVLDQASTLLKTINIMQGTEYIEQETIDQAISDKNETNVSEDFNKILEQNIENPTFEPVKTQDKLFLNLVNSKNTTDKFNYLVITAYYLAEFEKLQRFSLKQINSKMMQNLSEVIDHATLQEAINQGFIEVVPDLTGISDVAEYKLTLAGEEFFANKI